MTNEHSMFAAKDSLKLIKPFLFFKNIMLGM